MTQNRDDFQLAEYLMAGNEKDVFTIAPESFSDGGKNILAAYAINVGIKDIDSGNGLQNLQNFTNHMLSAENWKEKEYMEIMSVYCGLQREAVATAMWKSEGLDMTLVNKMEKVNAITGFYQSLYITGYDMQLDYAMLTYQKLHICVEDLQLDEYGAVNYTVVGYNQEPTEESLRDNIVSETHWSPLQANSDLFISEMNKINEQIQTLWQSCAVDLVIKSTGLVDGNCAKLLTLSKAIYEDNIKSGVSAVSGLKAGEKKFGKGTVYAADVFGIIADYYQKKEKLEADYNKEKQNSMVKWFYSSNLYDTDNGKKVLYNVGIYDEWNRKGIEIEGKTYSSSIDNVTNINSYLFITCISMINDVIAQHQGEKAPRVASYLEGMNYFTVSPELQELVVVNEDGTFAFEELLQKDLAELTEKEFEMLQMLYQELCTSIEQADGSDACMIQKDMLERYLKQLYKPDIVYE